MQNVSKIMPLTPISCHEFPKPDEGYIKQNQILKNKNKIRYGTQNDSAMKQEKDKKKNIWDL